MDDFRRPTPQPSVPPQDIPQPQPSQPQLQPTDAIPEAQPLAPQPITNPAPIKPKKSLKKKFMVGVVGLIIVALLAIGGTFAWYTAQLTPVDMSKTDKQLITVEAGNTPTAIANQLKGEGLIRNETAFLWYAKLNKLEGSLKAGSYRLSPSESTPEIIEHLSNGTVDTFSVTFLPGATLEDNRKVLIGAGYSEQEVDEALNTPYDSPLFAGKPADATYEGYIYGETYNFGTNTSVTEILAYVFEYYNKVVIDNGLTDLYASQGLSLYEGITLASIVQREASASGTDMPQIAQVFYSRLAMGMPLGSDVTYQYIADKTGVPRDTNLDSPYNTRRYAGLPPGPISVPGLKALQAVGSPAEGDYLYFLSGDDNITYYGRTLAEHEANIVNHCKLKCQIL